MLNLLLSRMQIVVIVLSVISLAACESTKRAEPINTSALELGISPKESLPKVLPKDFIRFENSPFVFANAKTGSELAASFAVGLIVPIPFVSDSIVNSHEKKVAEKNKQHYLGIDTYKILYQAMMGHPNFKKEGGEFSLYPLVVMEECVDDVYRLSLLFQVERDKWMNRYYYHLPTPIPKADIANPTEPELAQFELELNEGAEKLLQVIDRQLNGDFPISEERYKIGSLYILGSKIGGMVDPHKYLVKDSEIMEKTDDHLIARLPGKAKMAAVDGGLAYGVHYFYLDQVHTLEKQ